MVLDDEELIWKSPIDLSVIPRNWLHLSDSRQNINSNKSIKMSYFKSSENILKKDGRPDRSVLFSDPDLTGNESQKNIL